MTETERNYCLRRADEERARAASSAAPDVAQRHATLAGLFELYAHDPVAWTKLSTQHSA